MNRTDAPAKQPKPFGINGQREAILPTTPAGDNTASYESGFPPITMILKSAGGLPPKGQDVNQILYELSALCRWASSGALNSYDATFSTGIGGYPKGAVILSDDAQIIYINTVDSNINNPNSGGSGWMNAVSFLGLSDSSGYVGRLLRVTTFPSSATYTFNPLTKRARFRLWGAGQGGGSAAAVTSQSGGPSGAAGGYVEIDVDVKGLNLTSVPITIGIGGQPAVLNSGTQGLAGGNTSVGTLATANGGSNGVGGTVTISPQVGNVISIPGQNGTGGGVNGSGGVGGASSMTYGGLPRASSAGQNGANPGGGGAGGANIGPGNNFIGGVGGNGLVILEEYA